MVVIGVGVTMVGGKIGSWLELVWGEVAVLGMVMVMKLGGIEEKVLVALVGTRS